MGENAYNQRSMEQFKKRTIATATELQQLLLQQELQRQHLMSNFAGGSNMTINKVNSTSDTSKNRPGDRKKTVLKIPLGLIDLVVDGKFIIMLVGIRMPMDRLWHTLLTR